MLIRRFLLLTKQNHFATPNFALPPSPLARLRLRQAVPPERARAMDASDARYFGARTPDRSATSSPRSHASSPNSASSINVTDQSISLSQHQHNLETLNRMGMFFHAQQMQLNQSLDAVKSRLALPPGAGPRHTIDAILGLSRPRAMEPRQEMEPAAEEPGAAESAGECLRQDGDVIVAFITSGNILILDSFNEK